MYSLKVSVVLNTRLAHSHVASIHQFTVKILHKMREDRKTENLKSLPLLVQIKMIPFFWNVVGIIQHFLRNVMRISVSVECMKESTFHDIWIRNVGKDPERPTMTAQSIMQSCLCALADKIENERKTILVTAKSLGLMRFPLCADLV